MRLNGIRTQLSRWLSRAVVLAILSSCVALADSPRPNVVFILADDLGCYGGRPARDAQH